MRYIFKDLFQVIEERKKSDPAESYVSSLMNKGSVKISEKIREEAEEVCEASSLNDKSALVHEICDLLFHTFVMAGYKNIALEDIEKELERRFGTSGLEEKELRNKK